MNLAFLALHSSPTDALGGRDAGGMSVVLVELAAALARRGHRVDLFTCRGGGRAGEAAELVPGVRLVRLGAAPAEVSKGELHRYLPALGDELQAWVARAGERYRAVYSHYWLSGVLGQRVAAAWGVPHWVTFHTLGAAKNRLACGEDAPARRVAAEARLAAAARVIVPCRREAALLAELCAPPPARVEVVPWGVDGERFSPGDRGAARDRRARGSGAEVVLFVGRLAPVKGLDLLLAALPEVARARPRVCLRVVGGDGPDGPDTRVGRELAAALGVAERVAWLGPVPRGEMPGVYRDADLLAVPSRYESFGLAPLEALACGTPVVATRVGVLDEVVVSGVNGRLVENPDPDLLASAIVRQLSGPRPHPAAVRATVGGWIWDRPAALIEMLADQEWLLRGGVAPGHDP